MFIFFLNVAINVNSKTSFIIAKERIVTKLQIDFRWFISGYLNLAYLVQNFVLNRMVLKSKLCD